VLQIGTRQAFEWPENSVLVNGLERHCHVFEFSGFAVARGLAAAYAIFHDSRGPGPLRLRIATRTPFGPFGAHTGFGQKPAAYVRL
jgi:hypothetical protein